MKVNWIETKNKMPSEGDTVLAIYGGDMIVLEVGCESPSWDEPQFKPFLYWREPVSEYLIIENILDVSHWCKLPCNPGNENGGEQ